MTDDKRLKRTSREEWGEKFNQKVRVYSEDVVDAIEKALDAWDACAPLVLSVAHLHSFRPAVFAVVAEYKAKGWAVEIAQERVIFTKDPQ